MKSNKFKIVAVCIATIILGINMSYAQDGHRFLYGEPGYAGNISFAIGKDFVDGSSMDLLTSHGYSFGNGLYLGMGTGVLTNHFAADMGGVGAQITVPLFADIKYSFINKRVSPYIALKTGIGLLTDDVAFPSCLYVAPSVGVDIGRFSLGITYAYERNLLKHYDSNQATSAATMYLKIFDKLQFGVTYNF